jgi:hypothetical protein
MSRTEQSSNSAGPVAYRVSPTELRNHPKTADTLNYYAAQSLGPSNPLIVASFVNVNNLEEPSSFGRIIAEQVASRFTQRGQPIIELKLRQNSIFISEGKGEFMLRRSA